ncbi:hypothetical protein SKAU_G00129290 [Synaphobranchus kaupii]|uniref:Uncharacterized protein n=1 Tax=Synaphobranchus kaupii TaxID=118154 RepID=A0A9Q1J367_SYNKA|nr:hypothetical protein SKAU_G00129290 [Synaphobranchus kaupii]
MVEGFFKPLSPSIAIKQDADGQHSFHEQARLLPMELPEKICGCAASVITVTSGKQVILIGMNVNYETIYEVDIFSAFEEMKITAPGMSRQAFIKMLEHRTKYFGRTPGKGICGTSQWAAAKEFSRRSTSKVDEEGLEVAVCRHGILLKALNMFRGEIFAYPLFLQKELASANVKWGGRNQHGAGTTIGEEVEQVNSFLSRTAICTKYMSKAARTDMLTVQVMGWNNRKFLNLDKTLAQRYIKTIQRINDESDNLESLRTELEVDDNMLQQWVTDVQQCADSDSNKRRHRIRRKVWEEKKGLSAAIADYNDLVAEDSEKLPPADVLFQNENHVWPWECHGTGRSLKLSEEALQGLLCVLRHRLHELGFHQDAIRSTYVHALGQDASLLQDSLEEEDALSSTDDSTDDGEEKLSI